MNTATYGTMTQLAVINDKGRDVPGTIFTGYRVPAIKTVFYRVRLPNTEYLTN